MKCVIVLGYFMTTCSPSSRPQAART